MKIEHVIRSAAERCIGIDVELNGLPSACAGDSRVLCGGKE